MVITSRRGIEGLLRSKFTLGGDISVAAGPVGRKTEVGTDILLKAEIYSYSRTKGLFAGISLEGAVISHDNNANRSFYGRPVTVREVLFQGGLAKPPAAIKFVNTLARYSSAVR
jgi:lipid-binding SYLF domain-containing protein